MNENKDLLLKYLCMALPYRVICSIYKVDDYGVGWRDERLTGYFFDGFSHEFYFGESPMSVNNILNIKPYLRPMSSMTEEEENEFEELFISYSISRDRNCVYHSSRGDLNFTIVDWLNTHHFDFMDLISKGLGIEVTKDMMEELYNE